MSEMQQGEEYVEEDEPTRCGYAFILGRPNAGKSTLINQIIGEKVSIVSWKPQTTRNRIIGIHNDENLQIIFVDTPGIHKPKNKLGDYMVNAATESITIILTASLLTKASQISNACSPVSG